MTRHHTIPPRRLLTIALICLLLGLVALSFVGCGESPTAPTSTRTFGWTAAPGCSPTLPIQRQAGEPAVTVKMPGSPLLQAIWVTSTGATVTVNFQAFGGGMFLVCDWKETK